MCNQKTLSLFILSIAVYSCNNKSSDPKPVTSNSITITSISPGMVYTDESITITGKGFDPDASKNTVEVGFAETLEPGDPGYVNDTTLVFEPYYVNMVPKAYYVVASATATQLVIKPSSPDSLYHAMFTFNYNHASEDRYFRVQSNGAKTISKKVTFKNIPVINAANINQYPDTYALTPGDSSQVVISGVFSNSICDVSLYLSCSTLLGCTYVNPYLNSNLYYVPGPCTCDDFGTLVYGCGSGANFSRGRLAAYDEINHRATINFLVPDNFFNTTFGGGYGPMINILAQAINKDGKSSKAVALATRIYPTH